MFGSQYCGFWLSHLPALRRGSPLAVAVPGEDLILSHWNSINGSNKWWVTPLPAAFQGLPLQLGAAPSSLAARLQPAPHS